MIKKSIYLFFGWILASITIINAQSFELGWEGVNIIPINIFTNTSKWNIGTASGDYLNVTADTEALNLNWSFGSGERNKWVVYYLRLDTPISFSDTDIIGIDVKGSDCSSKRDFSLKFEDGTNQAVFYSHGLPAINRWVNRISIPKKQFSGNVNWNNISVIAIAISSEASAYDTSPDSGTLSIKNLKRADMNLWQRATQYETLTASNFLTSVKNEALQGIIDRQVDNGLLYSWREDNASWLYGQGLALKLLSLEGVWENNQPINNAALASKKLAQFLVQQQLPQGYWPRGWNTFEGTVRVIDEVIWMGDFPWIITGLVNYYAKSGDETVLPAIQNAKNFLYDLIEPNGQFYTINTYTGARILVTNTEAYTAVINSIFELGDSATAMNMLQYISAATWDNQLLYWKEGITQPRPTLFSNTWMSMLSYHTQDSVKAINSLSFVGKVLDTHGPGNPEGFDGIGPIATWYEGTLTYITAGGPKTQVLFNSIVNNRYPDGTIPSYNDNFGGKADVWAVNWSSLDATSWLYFAASKRSPFIQYHSFVLPVREEVIPLKKINIFPNPAKEKVNIVLDDKTEPIQSIAIYDILGNCLVKKTKLLNSNYETFDISSLKTGIYLCVIETDHQYFSKKIEVIQ